MEEIIIPPSCILASIFMNKRLISSIILGLMCLSHPAWASDLTAYIDEKQELSATVWILAGCEEYDRGVYPPYYRDIQRYFRKFKSHPVMDFIRQMRNAPDSVEVVAYYSVPCAAELLYIKDGHVKIKEGIDIAEYFRTQDPRWTEENFLKYAALLDDFYVVSDYHRFFEKHSKLYREYADSLQAGMRRLIDPDWFQDVYDRPLPDVAVCVSPAYAWNNYASTDTLTQRLLGYDRTGYYPIIGVSTKPEYASDMSSIGNIIIHEISHSFTNPLLEKYDEMLLEAGEAIYPYMEQEFIWAAYGASAVSGEFFNSLMTNMYLKDKYPSALDRSIGLDQNHGFVWMEEAVDFMDRFTENRDRYPTIDDFMPEFVEYMRSVAGRMDSIAGRPSIKEIIPAVGSTVSPDLGEIRVILSEPVNTGIYGFREFPEYESVFPNTQAEYNRQVRKIGRNGEMLYYENDTTFVIKIGVQLESGKEYGIKLRKVGFVRADNQYVRMGYDTIDIWFKVE